MKQGANYDLVSRQAGFSLYAAITCKSHQRKKLERLCRYITRPAIAERPLSLASNGNFVIALKTPYDDGTTHVVLLNDLRELQATRRNYDTFLKLKKGWLFVLPAWKVRSYSVIRPPVSAQPVGQNFSGTRYFLEFPRH